MPERKREFRMGRSTAKQGEHSPDLWPGSKHSAPDVDTIVQDLKTMVGADIHMNPDDLGEREREITNS